MNLFSFKKIASLTVVLATALFAQQAVADRDLFCSTKISTSNNYKWPIKDIIDAIPISDALAGQVYTSAEGTRLTIKGTTGIRHGATFTVGNLFPNIEQAKTFCAELRNYCEFPNLRNGYKYIGAGKDGGSWNHLVVPYLSDQDPADPYGIQYGLICPNWAYNTGHILTPPNKACPNGSCDPQIPLPVW